jgi:hypothetical protein
MLKIGSEKVYTETEILEKIRKTKGVLSDNNVSDYVVWTLAIALDESPDFIRGALGIKS